MGSRFAMQMLAVVALGLGACSSDDDPITTGTPSGSVAGAAGHAGKSSTGGGGMSGYSGLPVLGFAGFGTGRDATGACPTQADANMVCTGSFMDYFFCLSTQCATAYNECYGSNGYCLSAMGCVGGCPCGDASCEQNCYPTDCLDCMQRLNQCGSTSTCVPMVCTTPGAAGAPGIGEQGGAAGRSVIPSAGAAGRG